MAGGSPSGGKISAREAGAEAPRFSEGSMSQLLSIVSHHRIDQHIRNPAWPRRRQFRRHCSARNEK
jgi:hypothetical protein